MRHSVFVFFCLALGLPLAGCAVSIPLPSLLGDADDTTGSIDPAPRRGNKPLPVDANAGDLDAIAIKSALTRR